MADLSADRRLVELKVLLHGKETPTLYRDEAAARKAAGDTAGERRELTRAVLAEQIIAENAREGQRKSGLDPNSTPLFGAVAGIDMEPDSFDLGGGLLLRKTYAHIMAPYLLAFSPAKGNQPHPGPWKAASGGLGFDVYVEIALPINVWPTNFDRLNSIWWIVALLRLHHAVGVRVPVISNIPFNDATSSDSDPVFWTIEMSPRNIAFDVKNKNSHVAMGTLNWIRENYRIGALLMRDPAFSLAFTALDHSHWANTLGTAKILIWAALEALFRPGRQNITRTLSAAIATFLVDQIGARDRRYGEIKRLYDVRGQVAHAAEEPSIEDVIRSFRLARSCFLKVIETDSLPDTVSLMQRWRDRA